MMKVSQVLMVFFFLIVLLPPFIDHHLPFIVISVFSLFIGIRQFIVDRKELKNAINYARITNKISFWKQIGWTIVIAACTVSVYLIIKFYKIDLFETQLYLYYSFVLIASSFANHYIKFVDSIRSFDAGIKLPGRNQALIAWKNIHHLSLENSTVTVQISKDSDNFNIDNRDHEEMRAIIRNWEEKTYNSLLNNA